MPRNNTALFLFIGVTLIVVQFQLKFLSDYNSNASGVVSDAPLTSITQQSSTNFVPPPIHELTKSYISDISCKEPLMPLYDRIVDPIANDTQRIPRTIHFAWIRGTQIPNGQGRCISQDMVERVMQWVDKFPTYSIYFHDDIAVDAMFEQPWPEFPQLHKLMDSCVQFGSAMRIDIWRMLILYRYGGIYSDFDVLPGIKLSEESIKPHYAAMFASDSWNRPSQWLQMMESKSPIAYFTMLRIFRNLQELEDVSSPRLVFVTGPDALKIGYAQSISGEEYEQTFNLGEHNCLLCKGIVNKVNREHYEGKNNDDMVPYPRGNESKMITRKERIKKEMNTLHWTDQIKRGKSKVTSGNCLHLLFQNDLNLTSQAL